MGLPFQAAAGVMRPSSGVSVNTGKSLLGLHINKGGEGKRLPANAICRELELFYPGVAMCERVYVQAGETRLFTTQSLKTGPEVEGRRTRFPSQLPLHFCLYVSPLSANVSYRPCSLQTLDGIKQRASKFVSISHRKAVPELSFPELSG